MMATTYKPAANALAVFGILLATLSQSVCVADLSKHNSVRGQVKRDSDSFNVPATRHLTPLSTGPLSCRLWQNCVTYSEQLVDVHHWVCASDDPNHGYHDKVIKAFGNQNINEYLATNDALSGKTVMLLSDAEVFEDRIVISIDDIISLTEYDPAPTTSEVLGRRSLVGPTGYFNTIVLRVSAIDYSPPAASALSSDIFFDEYCLKTQYERCSYNKTNIIPYSVTDPNQSAPGVVDIFVNVNAASTSKNSFKDLAWNAANARFGVTRLDQAFDLVMFCFPPNLSNNQWIAEAVLGRFDSYYNDYWCQSLSAQMHEVGHNLGLHHSGEQSANSVENAYGDKSGMMGFSYNQDDNPKMCFNAAKNWELGWYADKQLDIDPATDLSCPTTYILNGIVDYENATDGAKIVMKVGAYYYLGFNLVKGFNAGTQEAKNRVTVIKRDGAASQKSKKSVRESALSAGGGSYNMLMPSGLTVQVTFVEFNGKDAIIELRLVGSNVPAECTPTAAPTFAPTGAPTGYPTTIAPTGAPTSYPTTIAPTGAPTTAPTTIAPTGAPTTAPTDHPTNSPVNAFGTPAPTRGTCTAIPKNRLRNRWPTNNRQCAKCSPYRRGGRINWYPCNNLGVNALCEGDCGFPVPDPIVTNPITYTGACRAITRSALDAAGFNDGATNNSACAKCDPLRQGGRQTWYPCNKSNPHICEGRCGF